MLCDLFRPRDSSINMKYHLHFKHNSQLLPPMDFQTCKLPTLFSHLSPKTTCSKINDIGNHGNTTKSSIPSLNPKTIRFVVYFSLLPQPINQITTKCYQFSMQTELLIQIYTNNIKHVINKS